MIQEYLAYISKVRNLSENTVDGYRKDLKEWITWASSQGLRWSTLTKQDIDSWLASMADEGKAPATRNRRLAALRSCLQWAMHEGIINVNPARFCQQAAEPERLPQGLSLQAVDNYLNTTAASTESKTAHALVAFMLESGSRIDEALHLRWEDIEAANRTATVKGKGNKQRKVFFGKRTIKALADLGYKGALIAEDFGQRYWREVIEQELKPHVGKMHPHQLRHTFAIEMLDRGTALEVIQKQMGHKHVTTTQRYAQVTNRRVQEEIEKHLF